MLAVNIRLRLAPAQSRVQVFLYKHEYPLTPEIRDPMETITIHSKYINIMCFWALC